MSIGSEVTALGRMTVGQLRARYAAVFGEATAARKKAWLVRRIAWRVQANPGGGLSDRARKRADELAAAADLRQTPPRAKAAPADAGGTVTVAAPRATTPGCRRRRRSSPARTRAARCG